MPSILNGPLGASSGIVAPQRYADRTFVVVRYDVLCDVGDARGGDEYCDCKGSPDQRGEWFPEKVELSKEGAGAGVLAGADGDNRSRLVCARRVYIQRAIGAQRLWTGTGHPEFASNKSARAQEDS